MLSLSRVEIVATTKESGTFTGLCASAIYVSYCENENDFNCEMREEIANEQYSAIAESASRILGEKWR
jgi:hypothetical protein